MICQKDGHGTMTTIHRKTATKTSELHCCPCCGGAALATFSTTEFPLVTIGCSKKGCKLVYAKTMEEAEELWNEPRFSQAR